MDFSDTDTEAPISRRRFYLLADVFLFLGQESRLADVSYLRVSGELNIHPLINLLLSFSINLSVYA